MNPGDEDEDESDVCSILDAVSRAVDKVPNANKMRKLRINYLSTQVFHFFLKSI